MGIFPHAELLALLVKRIVTLTGLAHFGRVSSIIAKFLSPKPKLIISGRIRRPSPLLTVMDRFILGLIEPIFCQTQDRHSAHLRVHFGVISSEGARTSGLWCATIGFTELSANWNGRCRAVWHD